MPYDINDISKLTGLGKSRILFYEKTFPEQFGRPQQPLSLKSYSDQHLSLFRQIDQMVSKENLDTSSIRRRLTRISEKPMPRIIAVTSGKGGVGKTFISANISALLSQAGYRTLLFDADLGLANVHLLASVRPRHTFSDFLRGQVSASDLPVQGPGGIDIICGASGENVLADLRPERLERAFTYLQETIATYDFLIIDNAAGISSSVMHFLKTADEISVISTPNTASVFDAYGTIKSAVSVSVPGEIGLLMNRVESRMQADHVFGNISQCAERFLNMKPACIGHVLEDTHVESSFQSRQLLALSNPSALSIRGLRNVANGFINRKRLREREMTSPGSRVTDFCTALLSKKDAPLSSINAV